MKSGGGPPQSKTWRILGRPMRRESVLDCGGPPPLFHGIILYGNNPRIRFASCTRLTPRLSAARRIGIFCLRLAVEDLREGGFQDAEQLVHHFGLAPEKALQVLHPLEVAHDHAARVAEHVGDDEDFRALIQDHVGLGRRRAVGGFGEDAALDFAGVGFGDLPLQRGGHEDVAGQQRAIVRW